MTEQQEVALLHLIDAAEAAQSKLLAGTYKAEIQALDKAIYGARVAFSGVDKLRQDFKLGPDGRCSTCFDRVCNDAKLLVGRAWVSAVEQYAGAPYHWAVKIDEKPIGSSLHNVAYMAACGKYYEVRVDSGD